MPTDKKQILFKDIRNYAKGVSEEHYAMIGHITADWSLFEITLDHVIWALVGLNAETGACLTSQMPNISRRFEAIRSLLALQGLSEADAKKLNKLIEQSNQIQNRRNGIVHAAWLGSTDFKQPLRFRITAKKQVKVHYELTDIEDLESLRHDILQHIVNVMAFLFVFVFPSPSPDKQK